MTTDALPRPHAAPPPDGDGAGTAPPLSRMALAVVALAGVLVSAYLAMYNLGMLPVIPCTTGGGCAAVQASKYAHLAGVPVSMIGLGGYAAILLVALVGLQPRFAAAAWPGRALAALAAGGVAFSAWLTYLEAFVIHAWCTWCVISAVLITLVFLLSLPGLRRAAR